MAIFRLSKLVRDNIPDIMRGDNQTPNVVLLSGKDLQRALLEKLKEEVDEALDELDDDEKFLAEMADVKEVYDSILRARAIDESNLAEIQATKRTTKGGFSEGYFVDTVTTEDDSSSDYYRNDPLRSVEIYPTDATDEHFEVPAISPGIYRHYKGNFYEVIDVGCHTETHEYFVVYRALYEKAASPAIWVRPYAMFVQTVAINGKTIPRFKKVGND